jgi:circadian clock protein KaiC
MVGNMQSPVDLTYLSDAVLLLRFFEAKGKIRRAISMLKKRTGPHESTIRELMIDAGGLRVGPRLEGFRGVLTGVPVLEGKANLLEDRASDGRSEG